ncbi:MAG: flagellar basal body-associated protein FliL [Armatimonadota bacterium]
MQRDNADSGGMLIKLIVLVALVGIVMGGGLFAWSRAHKQQGDAGGGAEGSEGQAHAEPVETPTQTVSLGEFLVNLQSGDGSLRYLQAEVSLVLAAPEGETRGGRDGHGGSAQAAEVELSPAAHRYARDVTIQVLSSQSFDKLRGTPDRSQLKALLQQRLDEALSDHRVLDVLFTAFVMQ